MVFYDTFLLTYPSYRQFESIVNQGDYLSTLKEAAEMQEVTGGHARSKLMRKIWGFFWQNIGKKIYVVNT